MLLILLVALLFKINGCSLYVVQRVLTVILTSLTLSRKEKARKAAARFEQQGIQGLERAQFVALLVDLEAGRVGLIGMRRLGRATTTRRATTAPTTRPTTHDAVVRVGFAFSAARMCEVESKEREEVAVT